MKKNFSSLAFATLTVVGALGLAGPGAAQVAGGTTTVDTNTTELTRLALGWSVKKTLLGKTIYNDAGKKVGKVEDLIISPDKNLSYVIVGAGGFVGIGRHDVAIPVTQIQDRAGKLVMPGATQDMIKAMPQFVYVTDSAKRSAFIASADQDIAQGKTAVTTLEKRLSMASTDAKAKINQDLITLQSDLKSAEAKLSDLKQAGALRWKEFETDVNNATARLRKSTEKAAN